MMVCKRCELLSDCIFEILNTAQFTLMTLGGEL